MMEVYVFDVGTGLEYGFGVNTADFEGREAALPNALKNVMKDAQDKFNSLHPETFKLPVVP
jgi:hypothetical protein